MPRHFIGNAANMSRMLLKGSRCGPANKGPLSQPRQFLNPISSNVVRYGLAEGFWTPPASLQTDKTSLAILHHCQSPLCERRPVRATFRQLCFVRMNAHSGDDAILCLFPWKRKLRGIVFGPYNLKGDLSKDLPVGTCSFSSVHGRTPCCWPASRNDTKNSFIRSGNWCEWTEGCETPHSVARTIRLDDANCSLTDSVRKYMLHHGKITLVV
jgi:hypothetical protein|uniref:Uncharacterized protein n=1 Tax=Bionectria ochroleuca TaxID=29856 RepID=A0A8H7TRL6_BIOOC